MFSILEGWGLRESKFWVSKTGGRVPSTFQIRRVGVAKWENEDGMAAL